MSHINVKYEVHPLFWVGTCCQLNIRVFNGQRGMIIDSWFVLNPPDKISLWDLDRGSVLSVFSPDARVQCASPLGGGLLLGLSQSPALIALRLTSPPAAVAAATRDPAQGDLFGESSSSEDEGR